MEQNNVKHITVGVLLIQENKILLMKRCNTGYEDGKYALVAGHVEENETLVEAMIREIKEEVGIIVKEENLEYMCSIQANDNYTNNFFVTKKYDGEPSIMEKQKCEELIWADLKNIPDNTIENDKKAIMHYINYLIQN